jgi:hypothetical protein
MTAPNNQDRVLKKLSNAAIKQRLGDISDLPKNLADYVLMVYREFVASYLNMLRQKENKPVNWAPDTLLIDSDLADGMRHFFSDYQHITRTFCRLNKEMDRLHEIDKDNQPNLYQHMIDDILKCEDRQIRPGGEYENTG